MNVYIYLLCYNEEILLPHTIKHYLTYIPSAKITIYDHMSTDKSTDIAKSLGCNVIQWNNGGEIDQHKYISIKNTAWKNIDNGWIIMADMDEWLCISYEQLKTEHNIGTTILKIKGFDIIGKSLTIDLSDIKDIHKLNKGVESSTESKSLCFYRPDIKDMNYKIGAHICNPIGKINYSKNTYINKHMNFLGELYIIDKHKKRYDRSDRMRSLGYSLHYDPSNSKKKYNKLLKKRIIINI